MKVMLCSKCIVWHMHPKVSHQDAVLQTRHIKPKAEGESGQITQNESPIHHSNVMLYSKDQKVRSKVAYK